MSGRAAPPIGGILETAVYCEDLDRARRFYRDVLKLECILDSPPRMLAFAVKAAQVLLVFRRGETDNDAETPGGVVPGHRSDGRAHFAFAIDAGAYEAWRKHLHVSDVAVISEVTWPAGGRSLYFHDPDRNVLEMATPGLWRNY